MRRRPRFWAWTLTITAALLAVVWVGSMGMGFTMTLSTSRSHWYLFQGCFGIYTLPDGDSGPLSRSVKLTVNESSLPRGVMWWYFKSGGGVNGSLVYIPLWPFILLTGVPGVWMLIKTRKHANPHACPACGYDRTGLPQTSTGPAPCPECGKR